MPPYSDIPERILHLKDVTDERVDCDVMPSEGPVGASSETVETFDGKLALPAVVGNS